jgi:hypothetical protein
MIPAARRANAATAKIHDVTSTQSGWRRPACMFPDARTATFIPTINRTHPAANSLSRTCLSYPDSVRSYARRRHVGPPRRAGLASRERGLHRRDLAAEKAAGGLSIGQRQEDQRGADRDPCNRGSSNLRPVHSPAASNAPKRAHARRDHHHARQKKRGDCGYSHRADSARARPV